MNKTKFIAHRGYSAKETENTISAFLLALNSSFSGIELDIHLTKDKYIVVHHDDNTNRLGNKEYTIKDVNYNLLKEVKLIDINTNEYVHNIPLLDEVLSLSNEYKKESFVEIKPNLLKDDLLLIYDTLIKYNDITIISFYLNNLITLREIDKNIKLQYLTSNFNIDNFNICKNNNINLDLNYKMINKERVKYFKEMNFIINTWTVNDEDISKQLIKYNINYITSDKIDNIK